MTLERLLTAHRSQLPHDDLRSLSLEAIILPSRLNPSFDTRRLPAVTSWSTSPVQDVEDRDGPVALPGDQLSTSLVDSNAGRDRALRRRPLPDAATGCTLHTSHAGRPASRSSGPSRDRTATYRPSVLEVDMASAPGGSWACCSTRSAPSSFSELVIFPDVVRRVAQVRAVVRRQEKPLTPLLQDRDGCDRLLLPIETSSLDQLHRAESPADRDLVSTGEPKPHPSAFDGAEDRAGSASRKATSPTLFVTPISSPVIRDSNRSEQPAGERTLEPDRLRLRTSAASSPDSVSADSSSSTAWRASRRERSMSSASCASALRR